MADESIGKHRRIFLTAFLGLWIPALILMAAASFINADTPAGRHLVFAMRVGSDVFMLVGLFLLVRYKRKQRRWRETGEWK